MKLMIQVLERAFGILEFIAEDPLRPRSLGEIAGHAGLKSATCANIVKSLCLHGYIEKAEKKKGYFLGRRVMQLTRNMPFRQNITDAAKPFMVKLARETGETVLIAALHRGSRSILMQVNGDRVVTIQPCFLHGEGLYDTATGRLLLAHAADSELKASMHVHGLPAASIWPGTSTAKKLAAKLSAIKKQEMVVHSPRKEVTGIAFPLRENAKVVAALGLFLPSFRYRGRHKAAVMKKMRETAEAISRTLTHDKGCT